jgi:hypothetical protein
MLIRISRDLDAQRSRVIRIGVDVSSERCSGDPHQPSR